MFKKKPLKHKNIKDVIIMHNTKLDEWIKIIQKCLVMIWFCSCSKSFVNYILAFEHMCLLEVDAVFSFF